MISLRCEIWSRFDQDGGQNGVGAFRSTPQAQPSGGGGDGNHDGNNSEGASRDANGGALRFATP
jgi:hypothetical protein